MIWLVVFAVLILPGWYLIREGARTRGNPDRWPDQSAWMLFYVRPSDRRPSDREIRLAGLAWIIVGLGCVILGVSIAFAV